MTAPALVFDLDGTLVDSLPGIHASLNRVLAARAYPTHPLAAVRGFIGNGARVLAPRAAPAGADIDPLESAFKADYEPTWATGTFVYEGVQCLLEELAARGHLLAVLSNKPHLATLAMVGKLFGGIPFAAVLGQRPDVPHKPDPAGFLEIAAGLGVMPQDCWMIGDSVMDVATARNAGARCLAVTWGYHDRAALQQARPDRMVNAPGEVLAALASGVPE